ncbi:related to anon-37cs protein [Cephalotrichum gorgonifer]|uniref:Related to anon-37cs protein n=1 Tax=Cephalotrichum gorgonifer TaxID=2041049 RepID=A0AAE8SQI3_9PEZI|nr:related to anon-37cs protein [Cephalotrichum gorgonifer]
MDSSPSEIPRTKPRVGIIGAGVSGLRCADVLLSHGFDVTILEARDRIGGRICQTDGLGYTVDLGANWIHAWSDTDEPHPIFKLAKDTDTPVHHWNNKQLIFDSSGAALSDDLTDRLSTLLWEIIEDAFKFSEELHAAGRSAEIPSHDSLFDFVQREVEKRLPDESERNLLVHMSEMFGAYVGEPVWRQSLRFAWMEECCGGEEMFVQSNYSAILGSLAQPALEKARLLLGTYVSGVSTPESRDSENKVTVTVRSGDTMCFDEIVVTTPLGWLKRNPDTFSPALPPRILSAIDSLSLSQLEKVYITFPSTFWKTEPTSGMSPCYVGWLKPNYAPDTNPSGWPQEIWDLSSFNEKHKHPTILFYIFGDCSRALVDKIHGKSSEEKHRLLDDFFRPYYSRLPGFEPGAEACVPKAILATEWYKDDLAGNASYCNFPVGIEEADEDVRAFRAGCPERRLWFCGEHAAPFEECGTVAGAYLSGETAAKNIVGRYTSG